jgi:fructokinase
MRIGIDLGGTKIEVAVLAPDGTIGLRRRHATPAGDYAAIISTIKSLVDSVEAEIGRRVSVGVAIPGAFSPVTGLVKNANSTCLIGRPFDRDLMAALERPLRFANDANCFVLSEAADGAARGASTAFGVILGTGVGGGVVVGGKLLVGANAIAGEWGHSPLPWPRDDERPGPRCYCGKRGCIEAFLSGPSLARDHTQATGETLEATVIAAHAVAGDGGASASLERYVDRLARGLAMVMNLIDPDVIVLGGGVGQIAALCEAVPRRWGAYVFSDTIVTQLVPPKWGDSSGVRGAAWLWAENEGL